MDSLRLSLAGFVERFAPAASHAPATGSAARVVYLCGNDGTGKTSQARLLLDDLARDGTPARYVWLRFPQLVSLPVLLLSRVLGITRYETVAGRRTGRWEFERAPWLARALLWTQAIDAALFRRLRIDGPVRSGVSVVVDRFALDIVVDIAAAANDPALLESLPARLLCRMARPATIALLDADVELLRGRREDLAADPLLGRRADLYRRLARRHGIPMVDATRSLDEVRLALRGLGA